MKYENAKDILPEQLLRQVQRYAAGKLLYIPSGEQKRFWGETSGYRQYLRERNRDIRAAFKTGAAIEQLSEEYYLSFDSIKKIVYSKKEEFILEYHDTTESAMQFAENGRIEEWIHLYLLSDGDNKPFSDGLKLADRYYIGPVKMPLSLFTRCCGPEENMKWRVNKEWFEIKVTRIAEAIGSGRDMPPLIVNFADHGFELNDGNHRFEAFSRLGIKEHYVIFWITDKEDYEEFMSEYPQYGSNTAKK